MVGGRQHMCRVTNTQSPFIPVLWVDTSKATLVHVCLETMQPEFFDPPRFLWQGTSFCTQYNVDTGY